MERSTTELEAELLSIIKSFISAIKSERVVSNVTLDASLDRDLGIDSLGRVELFERIKDGFNVTLPDNIMLEADKVRDILNALKVAKPGNNGRIIKQEFVPHLELARLQPEAAETLVDALVRHAAVEPKRPHIYLQDEKGHEKIIHYGDLYDAAKKVAAGLAELGLGRHETVAIMLPTSQAFFEAFFGVLLAGGVPIPVYPPVRADKIEEYAVRSATILNNAEIRVLITFTQIDTLSKLLRIFIRSLTAIATVDMLKQSKHRIPHVHVLPEDPAMIQYTSGSTSDPKGVLLTHRNLIANARSISQVIQLKPNDVGVSWLPLYHDMGLIGAWFGALYHGFPVTIMSPLTFLSHPERWLWAIHYHRGTLSAGPNFAYELCVKKIRDQDIVGLDLSSWRLAFNGAEAVNPRTLERFIAKFQPYGFRPETFYPVYGLAESSVALTFPPINRGPLIDTISRSAFELEQRAIKAQPGDTNILEFVSCGKPIPDHDIRIVDEQGQELGERQIGSLHFSGPSCMQGYYHNPKATQAIYHEGWWDSGDLAYIAEGEVYITGRKKDIIIKAGRNLYPQEIEEVTGQITGVRKGCVVAFGAADPRWGTEKLVVVAETAETKSSVQDKMINEIIDKVSVIVGIPPDEVCLVPPRRIPKTSSGKLQRSACKSLYQSGALTKKGLPAWLQITKLFIKGAGLEIKSYLSKVARLAYTAYVTVLLAIFVLPTWLSVLLLPKNTAFYVARFWVKLFLFLAAVRLKVEGEFHLKQHTKMVFVANHASYLDSVILMMLLPPGTLFIGKQELARWPLIHTAIKKFGYLTVDRMDFSKNLSDTDKIIEVIRGGSSVLIYPEGTFTYATGLRPFKLGAFKVAVDTSTPLCPIALKGTRQILRGESWLLSLGKVEVYIGKPIIPEANNWHEVTRLHSEARTVIAEHCGELAIDMITAGVQQKG